MRGLGIGIILTTLVLTIGRPKEKLSDQEIMRRATELGMVMEEDNSDNLDKVLDEIRPTVAPTLQPSATITPEPTAKPTPTDLPPVDGNQSGNNSVDVTFTIKSGMSSGQVSKLLVEKGVVDNADDFNQYIVSVGKASVIRVGTYTIKKDATYKDIVDNITK